MPVNFTRLGSGTLTVGTVPLDISSQIVGAMLASTSESGDIITVLSGDQISSGQTDSFTLSGSIILDPNTGGIGEFSWTNHGTTQAFVFTPNTDAGLTVTGELTITRLDIGADEYGALLNPDFEWTVVGEPTITWGTPVGELAASGKK